MLPHMVIVRAPRNLTPQAFSEGNYECMFLLHSLSPKKPSSTTWDSRTQAHSQIFTLRTSASQKHPHVSMKGALSSEQD